MTLFLAVSMMRKTNITHHFNKNANFLVQMKGNSRICNKFVYLLFVCVYF